MISDLEKDSCKHLYLTDADTLQANLLRIHRKTAAIREAQQERQVVLAINRSDYMLDAPSSTLMQVFTSLQTLSSNLVKQYQLKYTVLHL